MTLDDLGTLIYYTWGQTGWKHSTLFGKLLKKTSASGGARHPIEAYLVVQRVARLKPGVYHYAVRHHALERLRALPKADALSKAFGGQPWIFDAPAAFVMTGVVARSMWKYRFARAYRVLLMDAGHLGQTFHLVATAMGLGPVTTAAFHDTRVESLLQVDGVKEPALYVAAVGHPSEPGRSISRSGASKRKDTTPPRP